MMRKIKEADPIVIDFLKNIFVANQDEEEGVFETDEEKEDPKVFIPKLFCQVGDKKSGWHSKTVQAFAALLLTILSGGQGGKFSMADKGKPPPPWFVGPCCSSKIVDLPRILILFILYSYSLGSNLKSISLSIFSALLP